MNNRNKMPSVTLVIFSYNQEEFIEEAIDGAFSQTYSPLKILISDDQSSDNTFDTILRKSKEYTGPHDIKVRRSVKNRGLLQHINDAIEEVDTDIVVMAAGDDVSYPSRTDFSVKTFCEDPRIMAVVSGYRTTQTDTSDDLGQTTAHAEYISRKKIMFDGGGYGVGAAYAYRSECFTWPSKLNSDLFSEDRILPLRAAILGKVCWLDAPLIFYRQSHDSLGATLNREKIWVVTHEPHKKQIERELRVAQSEDRLGGLERVYLLSFFRVHGFAASLIKRRSRRSDVLWRALGFSIHTVFQRLFLSNQGKQIQIRIQED